MEYTTKELSDRWDISPRRIRDLADKNNWKKGQTVIQGNWHRTFHIPDDDLTYYDSEYSYSSSEEEEEDISDYSIDTLVDYMSAVEDSLPPAKFVNFRFDQPIGVVISGDEHIGSPGVDYEAIKAYLDIVSETSGLFVVPHGDLINNSLTSKLAKVGAIKDISVKHQRKFAREYLEILEDSIIAFLSGNHEERDQRITGLDIYDRLLQDLDISYHPLELAINYEGTHVSYRHHLKHSYRGSSKYHPIQSLFNLFDQGDHSIFGDKNPDIISAGHIHEYGIAEFCKKGRPRLFIRPGSFKVEDSYSRKLGFSDAMPIMPAILLWPDRKHWRVYTDLEEVASALSRLRS